MTCTTPDSRRALICNPLFLNTFSIGAFSASTSVNQFLEPGCAGQRGEMTHQRCAETLPLELINDGESDLAPTGLDECIAVSGLIGRGFPRGARRIAPPSPNRYPLQPRHMAPITCMTVHGVLQRCRRLSGNDDRCTDSGPTVSAVYAAISKAKRRA